MSESNRTVVQTAKMTWVLIKNGKHKIPPENNLDEDLAYDQDAGN